MDSAPTIDISLNIGAFQIGVLVSYLLAGVMITQTYMYYSHFPEDSRRLKVLVGFVWSRQRICPKFLLLSDYALKKPYIAVLCWILSGLHLLGDISVSITAVGMTSLECYEKQWGWLFMAVWCISTTTDMTIAATLVAILYNQRSNNCGTYRQDNRVDPGNRTLDKCLGNNYVDLCLSFQFVKMEGNLIWLSFFNVGARYELRHFTRTAG
ncbi:hypothetical protein B0H16DRAFT_1713647 [Mycena metata]|uniref:Uncharacterized protein n=1 Tax=Mycena metata TaxID=1033252 RepID=A0AAD7NTD8_9AGAR|nr:hypothetical protein B0H16DRAFT_1713647 [Mycena metata]